LARGERRLAAILAADVVGYSRLMGRDESGTLAGLKTHRTERFDPTLARHGGRLVKLTGDGALAEFPSAVDALSAAIEFQQIIANANLHTPGSCPSHCRTSSTNQEEIRDALPIQQRGEFQPHRARLSQRADSARPGLEVRPTDSLSARLKVVNRPHRQNQNLACAVPFFAPQIAVPLRSFGRDAFYIAPQMPLPWHGRH
jgi:hypothetical protein